MRRGVRSPAGAASALALLALSGCAWGGGPDGADRDAAAMTIEVEIASAAATAARVRVVIDARNEPKRVDRTEEDVPYRETFRVPLNVPFPLTGTEVEATASGDATWVSCRVTLDGEVIAEQHSEGPGSIAVCEKRLRPGPQ